MNITYWSILNSEYLTRQGKNSAYSLRCFARDLGISQSFLSQILNRKRNLSLEKALTLMENLRFDSRQQKLFLSLVEIELVHNSNRKASLLADLQNLFEKRTDFKYLTEDIFRAVSEWHYFAILEATSLSNFKSDPKWISKKLNLPLNQTRTAISRLLQMGLLKTDEQNNLIKVDKNYIFENVPSLAIRMHHESTLKLAQIALRKQEMSKREFHTACFSINPRDLKEIKSRIQQFQKELMTEFQDNRPTAVYKIATQFFRLDQESV